MCKLLGRIVKLVASMSTRRYRSSDNGDETSPCHRDAAPAHVPRQSMSSSSKATPKSSVSRSANSHVRTASAPSCSPSEFQLPPEVHGQMSLKLDGAGCQKRSIISPNKDQASVHSREREGDMTGDEHKKRKEDQHLYNGRTNYRRNTTCGTSSRNSLDIRPSHLHTGEAELAAPSSATIRHLCETQSRKLSALQDELRVALEEKKKYADAYASLKLHYDERSKKLSVARHERQAALQKRNEINDAYATLRAQCEEQTKKLKEAHHEHLAFLEQKKKAEEEFAALKQKYDTQRSEYSALNNKYQPLRATLEQRTSELQGVQRFLATADAFSGAELVGTLRKLNEGVQQSTTFMAEWAIENFTFETPPTDQSSMETAEQTRASETLGMRFMQLLGTRKHKEDPLLVEIALRAYLIYELYWIASPWSIGQEEQSHNVYIDAIYQRMRDAEGQAISGNWRALTRAYTLPACISDAELVHTINTTIISGFADILLAAGCTLPKSDITSVLWTEFGEKIHNLVSLAGQVNKITGVGMISEDFEVLVIWPDSIFDEKTMEDSYDNGDRTRGTEQRQETVLFATDLGLMQRMSVGADAAQREEPSEFIVMKPKIVFASVIDIME